MICPPVVHHCLCQTSGIQLVSTCLPRQRPVLGGLLRSNALKVLVLVMYAWQSGVWEPDVIHKTSLEVWKRR